MAYGMINDVGIDKQRNKGIGLCYFLVILPVIIGRDKTHNIAINIAIHIAIDIEAFVILIVIQSGITAEKLYFIANFQGKSGSNLLITIVVRNKHRLLLSSIHTIINGLRKVGIKIEVDITIRYRLDG